MSPRNGCMTGLVSAGLLGALAASAEAQEYCVACSQPDGLYRCVIDGAQPRGGQSLQMLCVTAMAKEGRHATCSVKRATVFECDAAVKHVPWAALDSGPQAETSLPPPVQPLPKPAPTAAIADRPERLHRASRPADAHRCGRGADAQGDGRSASRRSNEPRGAAGRLSRPAGEPAARAADRLQSGPWPCPR